MKNRKLPICVRPNCTRAVTRPEDYDGLCFRHAKAAGIAYHFVPWEKVHAELERLTAGGWTLNAIEEDYIVFNNTLRDIKYHRRDRFKHSTYQALKEIPTLSPYRRPAWPLRRRVNALRAIGITFVEISEEIGEKATTVQYLSYERAQWATPELDTKIRAYYQHHANDPVQEIDTRTKKLNLPRPYDWDDIDNPNEHAQASIHTRRIRKQQVVTLELRDKLGDLVAYYGTAKTASLIRIAARTVQRIRQGDSQKVSSRTAHLIEDHYDRLPARGGQAA